MTRFGFTSACALFMTAGMGCVGDTLTMEQDHVRQHLLKLHDEQIMDNLIRVYNFEPILQLEYKDMTGTVTDTGTLSAGASQTDTSGAITNMFNYGVEGSRKNQLTITGTPVNDTASTSEIGSYTVTLAEEFEGSNPRQKVQISRKNFSFSPGIYQKYVEFVWCTKESELDKATKALKEARESLEENRESINKLIRERDGLRKKKSDRISKILQSNPNEANWTNSNDSEIRPLNVKIELKSAELAAKQDVSRMTQSLIVQLIDTRNLEIDLLKSKPLSREFCYECDCSDALKPDCGICERASLPQCGTTKATSCELPKCDSLEVCHTPKATCRLIRLGDSKPSRSEALKYHKIGEMNGVWYGIPKKFAVDYFKLATSVMVRGSVNAAKGEDSVGADVRLFRLNQQQ
ncbi:MAG: hypothetical protein DHS20C16_23270 [Phycisphaerae bacterium]|nr:MAG: hypothetical protein DHS20C16_23270 [Phycisphaerae bacterium]